uniref:Ig-like domain-containing protein n=1 Tax=Pygocentrus nattereri TaxID=42514 RepID=A0A3B4DUL3_PYGNA
MKEISSVDSGEYKCRSSNEHGEKLSEALTLNVLYPPKSVSVSISPSGVILEGSSVTLTCSSDGNPPVEYNWIKGTSSVGKGKTYTKKKISSVDSGEYKCRSSNEHGEKLSEALTLNVLYLQVEVPERVIEGDEVTLTCKTSFSLSDRPTFTWYRNGHPLSSNTDQLHLQPVSREDAGSYDCAVWSKNLYSPEVTLNVRYLQVEVPERVIEGDEVTLTCKTSFSLSDRPTFTWYRNGHPLSSSTDQLHLQLVSREDADRYRCAVLGLRSPEVTLNVRYGPKSVSVSISPSGEIVEGRSVTLTCSSDANPPVEYNWIKGTSSVGKGETYTMMEISSVDSGEYKCRSSNEHGEKLSEALTLNVLYPPKSVSVSISPSGETAEGSSVNLTCSSDANPPVQNYTWFKEGGSSPVGSGHSYRAPQRGSYYCEAQNEHGSQKSAAVTVKGVWNSALYAVIGVTAGCGCLSIIIAVFCVRRKRRGSSADDKNQTQNVDPNAKDDTNTALDPVSRTSDDVYNTLAVSVSSETQFSQTFRFIKNSYKVHIYSFLLLCFILSFPHTDCSFQSF